MPDSPDSQPTDDSSILDEIADDFLAKCRAGEKPDIELYATENPRLADEIRGLLKTLGAIHSVREKPRVPVGQEQDLYPGQSLGRYVIERRLGAGGMGVVYLAKDPTLDRLVALKQVSEFRRDDIVWLERFRREAKITSRLNHPNVLTIHEIHDDGKLLFVAEEYVDGITLKEKMARGDMEFDQVVEIASQIASGTNAAHEVGVIHRDLKPANIMVREDGVVKILDFGLAKLAGTETDETNPGSLFESKSDAFIGTAAYMSPEQLRQQPLDTRSDVFSIGIILFKMLSGEHPFAATSIGDVIASILNDRPEESLLPLSGRGKDLATLTLKCLKKTANERPSSKEVHLEMRRIFRNQQSNGAEASNVLNNESAGAYRDVATKELNLPDQSTNIGEFRPPKVRYTTSGDVNIAWQEIGSGPIDIVFVMGWVSHLDYFWKEPGFAAFLKRLASFARVILFDKRGTGLSDKVPVNQLPTLETRMDDVRAVMEAAGSKSAVLCGVSEGGPLCSLFAATYPQKSIAIVMIGCYSRRLWAEDYPWGPTADQRHEFLRFLEKEWGEPLGLEERAPSKANDPEFRQWWADYLRMGASPGAAVALTKMNAEIDIRSILPTIQVPTLVIHRSGDRCLKVEEGRYMAERIPGAKFVELPGDDHLPFVGASDDILDEIEEFLTGRKQMPIVDRVLTTVVYISVDQVPDEAFEGKSATRVEQFQVMIERDAALFRGRSWRGPAGVPVLTFDGPARAVRAAKAISDLASRMGVSVCFGIDTGACDLGESTASGPAVDTACELSGHAENLEILVSESVKNLVSGAGLELEPREDVAETVFALR